jgi:hypothetical protein
MCHLGMQNRTFCPYLAATHGDRVPVMLCMALIGGQARLSMARGFPATLPAAHVTKGKRMRLVMFGMQNRTFDPCLTAINRILMSSNARATHRACRASSQLDAGRALWQADHRPKGAVRGPTADAQSARTTPHAAANVRQPSPPPPCRLASARIPSRPLQPFPWPSRGATCEWQPAFGRGVSAVPRAICGSGDHRKTVVDYGHGGH